MSSCIFFSVLSSGFAFYLRSVIETGVRLGSGSLSSSAPLWCSVSLYCLLTRLPSVYWTTFMPLPETGWLNVCDSISVYYVTLNEFLVSFSENEIWIANLGLAVGTFGRAVRGNRYTESFIGTLGHSYCSIISPWDSFIFKTTGRLAVLLLNVSKSVSAYWSWR